MLDPRASEHEIAGAAQHFVGRVRALLNSLDRRIGAPASSEELTQTLDTLARDCHARPVAASISLSGRIARMLDAGWWKRNLRRCLIEMNEEEEHAAGRIRRREQCYVSDYAVKAKAARQRANRETLEGLEVANEHGEAFNLAEVADASVSNPKLRRSELMVRCRGFEEIAKLEGHEAIFLTLTCPSTFHRFGGNGQPNPKWNEESTPKAAHAYLLVVWARIRAAWDRAGYTPYGFRVVEPHHDGCPHWHILLFAPRKHIGWFDAKRLLAGHQHFGAGMAGIAGKHALRESGSEPGAVKHRFTLQRIDPNKGSATGYIAKYISKNIDGKTEGGESIGLDFDSGTDAVDASQRVPAWASTWGIRQFQQIGGPSVTVWREVRRLGEGSEGPLVSDPLIEGPRSAADRGMWAMYWFLQGGPNVPRRELTLRPLYVEDGTGKYGDTVMRVRGVISRDPTTRKEASLTTRIHRWSVQTAGQAAVDAIQADWSSALRTQIKHADFLAAYARIGAEKEKCEGEAFAPWTRVNNYTDSPPSRQRCVDFDAACDGYAAAPELAELQSGYPPPTEHLSRRTHLDR